MKNKRLRLWVAIIALNLMNFTQMVEAATITLATSPLANVSTDVVRPNIMYVLDNSGSMRWDYLPDYVSFGISGVTGSQICWNGTNNSNSLSTCNSGTTASPLNSSDMTGSAVQVPFMTSDINYIYYNPNTYYQPPLKADKTSYANSSVIAAYTDGFAASGSTNFKIGTTVTSSLSCTPTNTSTIVTCASGTEGLTGTFVTSGTGVPSDAYVMSTPTATTLTLSVAATSSTASNWTFKTGAYPHQVYCNIGSPTTQNLRGNGSVCKETTDTTAGSQLLFPDATFTAANVKSYLGPAYYYTMSPMKYCTDSVLTTCQATADGTHTVAANYRWCNAYVAASQTFTGCQDLRDATHTIPDYLGGISPTTPAIQASASLTINSYIPGKTITDITVNGTDVVGGTVFTAGSGGLISASAIAAAICTAIQSNSGFSGYSCPAAPAGATLIIKANIPPAHADYVTPNLYAVVVSSSAAVTAGAPASGTLTLASIAGPTRVDDITVGATSLIAGNSKPVLLAEGTEINANATTLAELINANKLVSGYEVLTGGVSGAIITVTKTTVGVDTNTLTLTGTGIRATGAITVGTTGQTSGTPADLGGISVGATSIVGNLNSTVLTNGFSTTTNATSIRNAVGSGFTATSLNAVVTVIAPAVGSALNGTPFTFVAGTAVAPTAAVPAVNPTGLITFAGTATSATLTARINRNLAGNRTITVGTGGGLITVSTANPLTIGGGNSRTPAQVAAAVVTSVGTGGTVKAYVGGNAITPTCAAQTTSVVCLVDNSGTITNGKAVAVGTTTNFDSVTVATTATAGGAAGVAATLGVTNFAPALSGAAFSGGRYAQTAIPTGMGSGASSTGPIDTTATASATLTLTGGQNPIGGRVNVGKFKRVDIVPSVNSYPATGSKDSGRTDCAGTTCTYAEELQNFANWYSYYRSRMLMMKTTSTLAFDQLDSKYRIGFDLLSNYSNSSINVEVAQFVDTGSETAGQRSNWWSNLTAADGSSGTPLRSSVLKMGKYYAGKLTTIAARPAVPATASSGTLRISSSTSENATITSLAITGDIVSTPMMSSAFTVNAASGCTDSCSSAEISAVAASLFSHITASAAYTSQTLYTASISGSTITFTATATGPNDDTIVITTTGTINAAVTGFTGGANGIAKIPATVIEPIQYSCQQNYTLLVTDGYWNTDGHASLTQLNGSTQIANQDNVNSGTTARPSYDGELASATCTDSSFSSCGTLADVAMYYYKTDLRDSSLSNEISGDTGLNVSANNVFSSPTDSNPNQHMALFTMGLGAPGTLRYRSDYTTAGTGDYADIVAGTKNWPAPKASNPTTIDDLWHAAVNGRGKYFSARDPQSVVIGLNEALASVQVREGSAAAAATSNLQPVAGDNFAYVATYTTVEWAGDLQARHIDLVTGAVSEPANAAPNECVSDTGCAWSAQNRLDAADWSSRNVYVAPTSGASGAALRAFAFGGLTPTEQAYFNPNTLNQYASVFAATPASITATKMVDFLRGDTSLEVGNSSSNPEVWRNRAHVLGDIVSTQPIFVRAPELSYEDTGYSSFATANAGREGVVYVSGNDGMVHAFAGDDFDDNSASGGDELWAYIPSYQLPNLKYLADTNYTHRYYLDGQITVSDVNFGGGGPSDWHTILVGGMGGGGTAYYALDITDPVNPKYLWEFTHANLGYTFGNASINKLPNGEWAVMFTSGYNNADGQGYLYAVNPETGAIKTGYPVTTGSGTTRSPSNLGKVSAWIDNLQANNTATHIYAGDMEGDLWRFNLTNRTVFKLAHLTDAATPTPNSQPITTRPELTLIDGNRVVYVGTGRYLGIADLADTNVQSFYAIKDTVGADNFSSGGGQITWEPRTDTDTIDGVSGTNMFILHKLIAVKDNGAQITTTDALGNSVDARSICTGANSEVDASTNECTNESGETEISWSQYGGWYFDFPDSGERMNVDMNLTFGTLSVASNVPASSACTSGGYGWLNFIDFETGLGVDGETIVSVKNANAPIVGINVIYVDGKLVANIVSSSGSIGMLNAPGEPTKFQGRHDLWRELDPYLDTN